MKKEKAIQYMRSCFMDAFTHSKDPSTKVACRIVGEPALEIRSFGYNGMPRGCDDQAPERLIRPEKYWWFEHAERNAIYNAARVGTALNGCTLIGTLFPCMDCARAIVQTGIRSVVSMDPLPDPVWTPHFERTFQLFSETGVEVTLLDREDVLSNWEFESVFRPILYATKK